MELRDIVREIPDFPEPGILFRDITPILQSPEALGLAIDSVIEKLEGLDFDLVAGPESRGFIFGVPVAYKMKKGFIPVRKKGKLPFKTYEKSYALEYGTATIEIHTDAIKKGQKVVIIDDLLATGGTCKALIELIEEAGGEVAAMVFLIELEDLGGRKLVAGHPLHSILKY